MKKLGCAAASLAPMLATATLLGTARAAQQAVMPLVVVRPISPPATPLPAESASAGVTRFSFIAYGDTRCDCRTSQTDNRTLVPAFPEIQSEHALVINAMLAKIKERAQGLYPVRFVVQSGDATFRGTDAERWNNVFSPLIEKITRGAGLPFFFAAGNHDVTGTPLGDPMHAWGLHNTLAAVAKLIPSEGSPRRLNGYLTFAFGYGNAFFIVLDSNIPSDALQLAWVTDQLQHLDRARYHHVITIAHHPAFTSGRYSGVPSTIVLPNGQSASGGSSQQALALRSLYLPLFRKHHVRMMLAGHDHLYDHWIERYDEGGAAYRLDQIVSAGGGAPTYVYTGEPDLNDYLAVGAAAHVRLEHLAKPGRTIEENPHHFIVIQVDGGRLSVEVVGIGSRTYAPYNGRSRIDLTDPAS